VSGARIRRDLDEKLRLLAQAQARRALADIREAAANETAERMRQFAAYMRQGREEAAARLAAELRQDLVNRGIDGPPAVNAGYIVALNGANLREIQEIRRIAQDMFLQTLMQVEKSHIPFPDEPPIKFPNPATWKRIYEIRKDRYEATSLTDTDIPE